MDHYFFEGAGSRLGYFQKKKLNFCTAKTAENSCKESHGKKIEQVLPTTQVPCLTFKKILAQGLAHQKIHYAQPKGERKISSHRKLPSPP